MATGAQTAPAAPEDIRGQLERVLAARQFQSSERHRKFLRYTVEAHLAGRLDTLKEYTLAVEVFSRRESFDPQTDPIVRVEANRIRAKMARYYQEEGRDDAILIEYPKGGYAPAFSLRSRAGTAVPPAPRARWRMGRGRVEVAAVLLLLGLASMKAVKLPGNSSRRPEPARIAVVPLMAFDPGAQALARSLSRELARELMRRTDVAVRDASGAPGYLQASRDVRDIGAQFGAVAVVGGAVRLRGERVRLSLELVDALNGYEIASATQDATLRELRSDPSGLARSLLTRLPFPRGRY